MSNAAALEVLERKLTEIERKANVLLETINDLRAEDGLAPRPPFGGSGGSPVTGSGKGGIAMQIRPDSFFGKKLQTAAREYLEMRKTAAGGATNPATPREIYEAIVSGGFQFETRDEHVALVGLRALLRKRSAFFHKLPNGTYGLTNWYEHAKKPKVQAVTGVDLSAEEDEAEEDENEQEAETATTSKEAAAS